MAPEKEVKKIDMDRLNETNEDFLAIDSRKKLAAGASFLKPNQSQPMLIDSSYVGENRRIIGSK